MAKRKSVKNESSFQGIAFNAAVSKAAVKKADLEGRRHWVVPMVMLTEGVHQGSKGPLYYPEEELEQSPDAWDHKPVVVYHPKDDRTACRPDVLNEQKVGIILNTRYEDGKLKAEAWLDVERCYEVDDRVMDALKSRKVMELSTGLYTLNEKTKGEWNGEEYVGIARNYRPDHLALLPDRRGACSTDDGAGLLRNEMSFSNISSALGGALRDRFGQEAKVLNVYDGKFIYNYKSKLYQLEYYAGDSEVELEGEPEEVQRVTEYRTKDGEFIGNSSTDLTPVVKTSNNEPRGSKTNKSGRTKIMAATKSKKKLVSELISNESTRWEEKHRKYLMGKTEKELDLMLPVENADDEQLKPPLVDDGKTPGKNKDNNMVKSLPAEKKKAAQEKQDEEGEPEKPSQQSKTQNKATSVKEWYDAAPPEVQSMFDRHRRIDEANRHRLISTITANERNKYTEDQLKAKPTEDLELLAELAAPAKSEQHRYAPDYSGAIGSFVDNEEDEEHLDTPVMNFGGEDDDEE